MEIHYGFDTLPTIAEPVVTVGSFDGVHSGHRAIIEMLNQIAGQSVIVTFDPHPRQVLEQGSDIKLLNSLSEKALLLEEAGVEHLVVVNFTPEFSRLTSSTFVEQMILGQLNAKTIVIGYNHHFGHNREGNFEYLKSLGLNVIEIPRRDLDNEKVSSTIIRKSLLAGDLQTANHYLGRPYFFITEIDKSGRLMIAERSKLIPPTGEYLATVRPLEPTISNPAESLLNISPEGLLSLPDRQYADRQVVVSLLERLK